MNLIVVCGGLKLICVLSSHPFIILDVRLACGRTSRGHRRYFQHAHFIPIVGVGKRGEYYLVHGDLPRQHPFGTTLRFTGPVPADSRQ